MVNLHFIAISFPISEIQIHEVQVARILFQAQQKQSVECQQDSALQDVNQHTEIDFIKRYKKRGAMGEAVVGFPTSIPAIFLPDDR